MPTHHTELNINGTLVDCRIEYTHTPGDPGEHSAAPEECREATEAEWELTKLEIDTNPADYGRWKDCSALLLVLDWDELIQEIKAGRDD